MQELTFRWKRRRAERGNRLAEKNRRAINAKDLAQKQQELFKHRLRIERVGQDA